MNRFEFTLNYGENALLLASENGHLDIVQYLLTSPQLKKHLDINSENHDGENALLVAVTKRQSFSLIKYLLTSEELKGPININHKNKYGDSILSINMRRSNLEMVKYLLSSSELKTHADINQKNDQGYNLLEKYTHNSLFGVKKELIEYFLNFTELVDTLNIRNLNVSSLLSIEDAEQITMELLKKLKVNKNLELDYFVNKIRENENSNNYNELNKYIESLNIKFRGKNLYNYLYKLSQLYSPQIFAEKFVNLQIKENILNHNIQNLKIEYFQIILKSLDENTLLNLYQKLVTQYIENNKDYNFLLGYVIVLDQLLENGRKSDYIYEYILNTYQSEENFSIYLEKVSQLMLETNISMSKEQRESIMRNKDISHIFYNYILNISLENELHINEQIRKLVKV